MTIDTVREISTNPEVLKRLAKYLAQRCFRNSVLEDLHAGITPNSQTGDYRDVLVRSPYGEIPWPRLSRLSDQEMKALDSTNLKDTAVVEKIFKDRIAFFPQKDSTASIRLIENLNDQISYQFKSKTNQFAVFSEIYYDKGWNASIDGKPTPYCKVNYVLRGMAVPAGEHTIEFRFEPKTDTRKP